jgi:hypothetical protein
MSGAFVRDDVSFYNSFISNSFYAYHYEAFEEILERRAPKLVLYDVRSGYLLKAGPEPAYDLPAKDPTWWFGAPRTSDPPQLTLADIDSMLSVSQTQRTIDTLLRRSRQTHSKVTEDTDDGEQYRVILASATSNMNRWLSDGSRVYSKEHDAIIVPRGQARVEEEVGERHVNEPRLQMLEVYVKRMLTHAPQIILYTPPVSPTVLEDPKQAGYLAEAGREVRAMAGRLRVDYCDLSRAWAEIGCTRDDFYDELHFSRHCNGRILRQLALGCAPLAGGALAKMLKPELIVDREP